MISTNLVSLWYDLVDYQRCFEGALDDLHIYYPPRKETEGVHWPNVTLTYRMHTLNFSRRFRHYHLLRTYFLCRSDFPFVPSYIGVGIPLLSAVVLIKRKVHYSDVDVLMRMRDPTLSKTSTSGGYRISIFEPDVLIHCLGEAIESSTPGFLKMAEWDSKIEV